MQFGGNGLRSIFRKNRIFKGNYAAFSPYDSSAIKTLVRNIDQPFKRIIEIGSWTGNGSTTAIVEELANGGGVLYCVDTWRGNRNVKRHQDMVQQYDIFGTFMHNVDKAGGQGFVKPIVMSSEEAASVISDHTFDLVFIDADHSYDETMKDIRFWLPKVVPGGIICGHDCEARAEDVGREKLLKHKDDDSIDGNSVFLKFHPGVILAVDEFFESGCHLWADEEITLEDGSVGRATIWDVRVHE